MPKKPKTLKHTDRGKGGGSKRGSARTPRMTRLTGNTTPQRASGGGGLRQTEGPMSEPVITASLRRARFHLGRLSSSHEVMDIWMRQGLVHMSDALQYLTEGQYLNAATALTAASGLISGIKPSTAPSRSASKKRGSL